MLLLGLLPSDAGKKCVEQGAPQLPCREWTSKEGGDLPVEIETCHPKIERLQVPEAPDVWQDREHPPRVVVLPPLSFFDPADEINLFHKPTELGAFGYAHEAVAVPF